MREEIQEFLRANFPQIRMHGGTFTVKKVEPEDGYAEIQLGGACNGCGISPMTKEAIRDRLPKNTESVSLVKVDSEDDALKKF